MSDKTRIRTANVLLRMLPEEKKILKEKADKFNMSMSDYLRDIVLFGNPVIIGSRLNDIEANKLTYELNRIGNNINQLAYQANLRCGVTKNDFLKLREEYDSLLELYIDNVLDR